MARREGVLTTRRLLIAAVVFGLFVVFDIGLFGWLILDSLSQREIEEVLLETRRDAEPLAVELEELAHKLGPDLWVLVSVAQEKLTYVQSVLADRELVRKLEIRDRNGTVVYDQVLNREKLPLDGAGVPKLEKGATGIDGLETPTISAEPGLEEVEVKIGDLGSLVVGLSREQLQRRIGFLRRDLIRQASLIGAVTLGLLASALGAILLLLKRARRLEEQALEAERLAYIGTLASGLAHEIRNPLNSLNLNMQMLEEESGGGGGSARRLLAITRSEISRLERLVTDFLSYARPRAPELEEVPAIALLERLLEVLAGELQARRVEATLEDRSDGALVRVDRGQLGQLLLNLARNALAAVEEVERAPRVRLVARRDGPEVVLEVIDNGVGIPAAEQERIFDLFYSTRKGGTGLGLAIAQRIAAAHGATLEVDSTPGAGTSVRLRLPAAEANAAGLERARSAPAFDQPPLSAS